MEQLRWVLLAAGIGFVVFVYMYSRYRRGQDTDVDVQDFENEQLDDSVKFSPTDWDDSDDDIADVRVVARDMNDIDDWHTAEAEHETAVVDEVELDEEVAVDGSEARQEQPQIIVLYVLAEAQQELKGDRINSVARSNGLVFGDMNIFHRLDDSERPVFSLANMIEPGSFNAETLHNIATPGLTFFMQPEQLASPSDAFDDMLQCAYRMAEMLGARLCNHKRQPMTEQDAEQYREIVAGYNDV